MYLPRIGIAGPKREVMGRSERWCRHGAERHRRHEARGRATALPERQQRALQPHGGVGGHGVSGRQDQAVPRPRQQRKRKAGACAGVFNIGGFLLQLGRLKCLDGFRSC